MHNGRSPWSPCGHRLVPPVSLPVLSEVDTPAPLIALAIGSGALFAIQVNSNGFWMWQALLHMTTRGTLKTVTVPTMLISVVSLGMILAISLFV
jgi:gluconate:H+ symporter, GntP family